jgi:alkylhydroperoxidase family enzyme
VALIADGYEESALTPREKSILRYVDAMLGDPSSLTDAQRADLLKHFDAAQVVELTAAIALFLGFSKIAVALGPPPDMPMMVVPTPDCTEPRA